MLLDQHFVLIQTGLTIKKFGSEVARQTDHPLRTEQRSFWQARNASNGFIETVDPLQNGFKWFTAASLIIRRPIRELP